MADATLEIEVKTLSAQSQKEFDKLKSQAEKSGKDSGNAFSSSFLKVASALVAAQLAKVFTKATLDAAAAQEKAVNRLNVALSITGDFSQRASEDMQKFASELQSVSRFGDETTLEMLALAKSMGATNEQAKALVSAAADASEALGMDFTAAVRGIGQTLSGQAGTLGRYIGSIRTLTQEELKAGKAIDLISDQFKGTASGAINTYAGAIEQNQNAWGDLLEKVGEFITKSPFTIKLIKDSTKSFQDWTARLDSFVKSGGLVTLVNQVAMVGRAINEFLIVPFELAFNAVKVAFNGINLVIATAIAGLAEKLGNFALLLKGLGVNLDFLDKLVVFKDSSAAVMDELAANTAESFEKIFDFPIADNVDRFIGEFNRLATGSTEAMTKMKNQTSTEAEAAFGFFTTKAKEATNVTVATAKQMADGFGNGVAAAVTAMQNGGNAMDAFAGVILSTIGDMAINIGKTLIAIGIGIDALKASLGSLTGGIAIAAGVALIATGALIKSFAGKLTASATSATSSLGGGGGGVAVGTDTPEEFISAPETESEPKTAVTLNIQGDIFDSEGTGERLVSLLNNAFDQKGVVLNSSGIA